MEEVKQQVKPAAPVQRPRAAASYAYFDFDSSLAVAAKMQEMQGGGCTADQLALWLDYKSTKSGTFVARISAAKQFGLISLEDAALRVTERAMQILSPVMPEDAVSARADAFVSVELFGKVYEKYKGTTIPPRIGMRNLFMTSYGLSEEAAERAVRVMFDSARQTGMFTGSDESRLVRPGVARSTSVAAAASSPVGSPVAAAVSPPAEHVMGEHKPHGGGSSGGGGAGGGGVPPGVHSAIVGLLRELPPPGSAFSKKAKQRFVKAFLATLDFVYPADDDEEESLA